MSLPWHSKDIEEVLNSLNTTIEGLSSEEAKSRFEEYGPNELKEAKRATALEMLLNQFKDIFVIMLIIATAIAYYVDFAKNETPIDAITIAAIVVLNALFGFVQEYRSEKAMEALKKLSAPKARVSRNGKEEAIPSREVVPGDILLLETGDRVAADARLIEVVDLRTNESILTGESTPVDKEIDAIEEDKPVAERKNMMFMATHIVYGRGKAVVTSTGMTTAFGRVAEMVQEAEEEEAPLKLKLEKFAKRLGIFIVVVSVIVFVLELLSPTRPGELAEAFLTSVALAVSAVPEGLPTVVTVTLALGARELAKRNAIIRRLSSVETLGSTTVICSDKTGTLTKGEMTARKLYVYGKTVEVTGVGYEPKGEFYRDGSSISPSEDDDLLLLLKIGALCNNASLERDGGWHIVGDPTEGALIVAAGKAGLWLDNLNEYKRIREIPFSSERKRMTTLHSSGEKGGVAFVKGAPEVLLERCTHILENGEAKELTEDKKKKIVETSEQLTNEALRLLGLAYRDFPDYKTNLDSEEIERKLVFVGLVGMIDPPREEAKEANRLCQQAGIKTVMITGDHKLTAVAVAKEIGIMQSGIALSGEELDKMSDTSFEEVVENVAVYARVSPEHKLRIVKALKKEGHIVAMTGDGVNDAPALKQADIGIAMGITGTDVTKEAADMVLADDNFATIVKAVEGGRSIYDNIRNFAFFLLRSNFDELSVIGTFALLGLELPLTAGMILWINLISDGPPAIALSQDPPSEDIMRRPPRRPEEGLLSGRLASVLATVVTQFVGTGVIFYVAYYLWHLPLGEARTLAFMQATMQELVVLWNCRSEKKNAFRVGFTNNKYLLLAVVFSAAITFTVPYTGLFGTAPMTLYDWALVAPFSLSGFLIIPEIFYNRKILRWR